MSDKDIFKSDPDPNENFVEKLVGEGKMYASVEALAKAVAHQIPHIERVESENAALRTELQHRLSLEEFVDKVKPQQENPREAPVVPDQPAKGLGPEDVKKAVDEQLRAQRDHDRREANARLVREALIQQFGPDINPVVKARAQELGLSEDYMAEQAQLAPQAFLALFEGYRGRQVDAPVAPPRPSVDTARFAPNNSSQKTWSYYERLRIKDPKAYNTPAIQNEIHREAIRQGPTFFDQ